MTPPPRVREKQAQQPHAIGVFIGPCSAHPALAKLAVRAEPMHQATAPRLVQHHGPHAPHHHGPHAPHHHGPHAPHHHGTAHHHHHGPHAPHQHHQDLIDTAEFLRKALKIDASLPVRSTIEEACYRLSGLAWASGKIDKSAPIVERAMQCEQIVRERQEANRAKAEAAKNQKAKCKAAPKRKQTAAAKRRPEATSKKPKVDAISRPKARGYYWRMVGALLVSK